MRFKSERVEKEYNSGNLSHHLVRVLHDVEDIVSTYGYHVVITHLYRTRTEQRQFYPDDLNKRSVHEFWRGADVSIKGWPHGVVEMVRQQINDHHIYDLSRPDIHTCHRHDMGRGDHLHLQVPV